MLSTKRERGRAVKRLNPRGNGRIWKIFQPEDETMRCGKLLFSFTGALTRFQRRLHGAHCPAILYDDRNISSTGERREHSSKNLMHIFNGVLLASV